VNKVGTQGIGSAAMILARLFAIFCRLAYYVFTGEDLWIFTYADDLEVVTMGPHMIDNTVLLLLLLATLRVPFSWKAHASMDSVGIGGYQADKPQMEVAWFSLDLDSKSAPWAF
jgi:hypothetical protein